MNIYNIGTTELVTIKDLAKKISNIMDKKIKIIKRPIAKGGTLIRYPDIKKIKKIGFVKKISLNQGLLKTIKWYENFYPNQKNK